MPRKSATKKPICHISDKVAENDLKKIREEVCIPDSKHPLNEFQGKYYCIFHLPTEEKDIDKFNELYKTRIEAVEKKLFEIEKLSETEQETAKNTIIYDFSYVWFPLEIDLSEHKFLSKAVFRGVTFSADADFYSASFSAGADFSAATFLADAEFLLATFSGDASFGGATFSDGARFAEATFSGWTSFSRASFSGMASFGGATFSGLVSFGGVLFLSEADYFSAMFNDEAHFEKAKFSTKADFGQSTFSAKAVFYSATFSGQTDFRMATFTETSEVAFRATQFEGKASFFYSLISGYLIFSGTKESPIFRGKDCSLDLQYARISDNKKIDFHTARLEPNWFINVDSSEFIFTDCHWGYYNNKKLKTKTELRKLEGINALLTQTCRQLAENYEESKGFEEASMFRQIASESKRLDYVWYRQPFTLHWWYWLSSFYGESWQRAGSILFVILFSFAMIYTQTNFQLCPSNQPYAMSITECKTAHEYCQCLNGGLSLKESVLQTFSTALFQTSEYRKPNSFWSEFGTIMEKILVPLQAALLALAIRRKFMR